MQMILVAARSLRAGGGSDGRRWWIVLKVLREERVLREHEHHIPSLRSNFLGGGTTAA